MLDYCRTISQKLRRKISPDETFRCNFAGEDSDFVRFNRSRIRQAGRVHQLGLSLELIRDRRSAGGEIDLAGNHASDLPRIDHLLSRLRTQLNALPQDPYFLQPGAAKDQIGIVESPLDARTIAEEILAEAAELDLVGLFMCGPIFRGFADSEGTFSWHQRSSYSVDFSCFNPDGSAVKERCAGETWDAEAFGERIRKVKFQLSLQQSPSKTLARGSYRAYLAPAALEELFGLLAYNGFHHKSLESRRSPLSRLYRGEVKLHRAVALTENHREGLAPPFTPEGTRKPNAVRLIEAGKMQDSLVDARASAEYARPVNSDDGNAHTLQLDAGTIADQEKLAELDTGLYISNVWYCNLSDANECRITGMTRYVTYWVEKGEIQAPVKAMRFDDSLFRIFGEGLIGLTRERQRLADTNTYQRRSTDSMLLPGAVVDDFRLTL